VGHRDDELLEPGPAGGLSLNGAQQHFGSSVGGGCGVDAGSGRWRPDCA
jgi:hypothetical protein